MRSEEYRLSARVFCCACPDTVNARGEYLFSLALPSNLPDIMQRVLDPEEFLSPYGVRSVSKVHATRQDLGDVPGLGAIRIAYESGEPLSGLFGGNSNWRGAKYNQRLTKEAQAQARQMWEKAPPALDPRFAGAYGALAWSYLVDWITQRSQDPQTLERAFALAQKAVALDDSLSFAHTALGSVYRFKKQHDARAIAEGERGVALGPNDSFALVDLAEI